MKPTEGRHCAPPFVARDGRAACAKHTHCARHWRRCESCGATASRNVPLAFTDPLRQLEAQRLERERSAIAHVRAAQLSLPIGAKR